jgi:hypothetical protein
VAGGVPRRLDHLRLERPDLHDLALADGHVDTGDRISFVRRPGDAAAMALLQFDDAGSVVAVMMGDENIGQPPAALGERGVDCARLRRIDRGRRSGRRIMDEDAVIVPQAQEKVILRRHGIVRRC